MKLLKKIAKWFGIVLLVLIVSIFVFTAFFINHFKTDVEIALKKQTGLDAVIEGNLQLKILPGFNLIVNKLNLINNESYFLRTESAEFSIDFQSYFFGQKTIITAIRLNKPQVFIYKNENGKFNFEANSPVAKGYATSVQYNLTYLEIEDGKLLYFNPKQNDTLLITGISLSSNQIRASGTFENFSLKKTLFEGILKIDKLNLNALNIRDIQLKVFENNEQVLIEPKVPAFYGGSLSGKAKIDLSQEQAETELNFSASNMKIDSMLMDFKTAYYLKGKMKLDVNIQFKGYDWQQVRENLNGGLSLSGENVIVYGFNTTVAFDKFKKTGKFSAVNAGAALMAGPVDAIFSNSKSLEQLLAYDSGDSLLAKQFISKWKFSDGIGVADDVAFREGKYRIAVSGSVNYLTRTFQNLTVSLLNKSGCPILSQQLNESFQATILETVSDSENRNGFTLKDATSSKKGCTSPYTGSIMQDGN